MKTAIRALAGAEPAELDEDRGFFTGAGPILGAAAVGGTLAGAAIGAVAAAVAFDEVSPGDGAAIGAIVGGSATVVGLLAMVAAAAKVT